MHDPILRPSPHAQCSRPRLMANTDSLASKNFTHIIIRER